MSTEVHVSGPLFEGKLDVKAGLRAGMQDIAQLGASLVRQQLAARSRYRTARYGHVVDAVRTQVKAVGGGEIQTRIYLGGSAAYLGPMLEGGTAPHRIPKVRILGTGSRRRLGNPRHPLRFTVGGGVLFRASADHPGTPAYRWRAKAQANLEPQIQGVLDRAMGRALTP